MIIPGGLEAEIRHFHICCGIGAGARGFNRAGQSDSRWREGIGNAVPSDAGSAVASVMGRTLLLAWSGETFTLSNDAIWVAPLAWAVSLPDAGEATE